MKLSNQRAAIFTALVLIVATAHANDSSAGESGSTTVADLTTTLEPESSGCGAGAVTDPADMSIGRDVARCDPGYPEPQPLPERVTVTLTSSSIGQHVAPILLADAFGEFEKENIDFELVRLNLADAMPQLISGAVDAALGGPEAAFFNAVDSGAEIMWVSGNFFVGEAAHPEQPQTGLWARRDAFTDPDNPDLAELRGTSLGSALGLGSAISPVLGAAFEGSGISLRDIEVVQIASSDMVLALENNAVQSGWLLDPHWKVAADNPELVQIATQTPGEPVGGVFFGERLLNAEPEVGLAFLRAMIRTINTYLDGDYKADDEVLEVLSQVTELPADSVLETPSLVFDWEIREGTTTRNQSFFIEYGVVRYDEVMPEEQLVNRSFYMQAVGSPS